MNNWIYIYIYDTLSSIVVTSENVKGAPRHYTKIWETQNGLKFSLPTHKRYTYISHNRTIQGANSQEQVLSWYLS